MSQAHLTAFLADLRTINQGININDFFGTRTSLSGLITRLQNTVNNPAPLTVQGAKNLCPNPQDPRLNKYMPAIQRLVSVWGRGVHRNYPRAAEYMHAADQLVAAAALNFNAYVLNVPAPLRPAYADLERYDDNPQIYNMHQGPSFFHQFVAAGRRVDVTGRSLYLKAGFGAPVAVSTDNGYVASLRLADRDLNAMAGNSIFDIGCGAAMFRAEMEVLFQCETTGIDLSYNQIPAAVLNAKRRYAKGMLYLRMLADYGALMRTTVPAGSAPLIRRLVDNTTDILNAFENNLPENGDVFNLAAAMRAYRGGRPWDYCVCMFLLCYFDAEQQTEAVLNMCAATRFKVYLHSGNGAVPTPRLVYDQDQIRGAYRGCEITVKDERTHHIRLR